MKPLQPFGLTAIALVGLLASNAQAQLFSNNSSSLGNGVANVRGSSGGRTGGGLGSSAGRGASGFGGTPGNQVQQVQQSAGQVTGNERFLRANRQPGQFVGADSADTQAFRGQASTFTGFDIGNTGGERSRQQNAGNQGRGGQQRTMMVRRVVVGFQFSELPPQAVQKSLSSRIKRIGGRRTSTVRPDVEIAMQGRTAILRGMVASADDRLLAERLARLEPGVSSVRNELTIAASAETATTNSAISPRPLESNPSSPASPAVDPVPTDE